VIEDIASIVGRMALRGIYHEAKLGLADDLQDANGQTVGVDGSRNKSHP
jgi:hypothetical protein